jgi:hypothetical protein
MNAKKVKQLRREADTIQFEWIKSLMSEDEAAKINIYNFWKYLPKETYIVSGGRRILSVMSYKWVVKMLKKNPGLKTYKDVMDCYNKKLNESITLRR